jgi:hypothetical protein
MSGALQIWDADTHKRHPPTRQAFGAAYALDYSPDSRRLVRAGGSLENVRVIEVPSGRYLPSNRGLGVGTLVIDGDSDVMAITTLRDSDVMATKTVSDIRLIDRQTQRNLKTIDADAEDLHLSVGAGRLVGAMGNGKVQIWPIPLGSAARIFAARRAVPRCLTFLQRSEAGLPPLPPVPTKSRARTRRSGRASGPTTPRSGATGWRRATAERILTLQTSTNTRKRSSPVSNDGRRHLSPAVTPQLRRRRPLPDTLRRGSARYYPWICSTRRGACCAALHSNSCSSSA